MFEVLSERSFEAINAEVGSCGVDAQFKGMLFRLLWETQFSPQGFVFMVSAQVKLPEQPNFYRVWTMHFEHSSQLDLAFFASPTFWLTVDTPLQKNAAPTICMET